MLPRRQKVLVAASTGGHLAQSLLVAKMLEFSDDSLWVTFDSPQSRSLLQRRRVNYIPYIPPRGMLQAAAALPSIRTMLSEEDFSGALSTGAAIAVPAMLAAVSKRLPAYYLESISRFDGPSLTGRLLERVPHVSCYTQHLKWAKGRWQYDLSIIDRLTAEQPTALASDSDEGGPMRVFVTLGTIKPYRFDALVDNVVRTLPPDAEVTWQLGATTRTDLPGRSVNLVPADEFDRLARRAHVVISHAGVGSALRLLNLGVAPVLVPRRSCRGEHVDDHQQQAARELEKAGLLCVREADELQVEDLERLRRGKALKLEGRTA